MSVEDLSTKDPYGNNVEIGLEIKEDSPEQDQLDQLMGDIYKHIEKEKRKKKKKLEKELKKDLFTTVDL